MIIRHTRFPAVNIFTDSITALILRPNTSTFLMMEILNTDYSADASFQTAKTKMQRQLGEWSRAYRFSFLFSKFSTKSVVREAAVIFTFYPFDHKFQFRIFLLTVRKGFFMSLWQLPPAVWQERPLLDSPWDLEKGFYWMHLSQRGISVCQLDGCDAERPHIAAGIIGVVVLLFTGYDLETIHRVHFRQSPSGKSVFLERRVRLILFDV